MEPKSATSPSIFCRVRRSSRGRRSWAIASSTSWRCASAVLVICSSIPLPCPLRAERFACACFHSRRPDGWEPGVSELRASMKRPSGCWTNIRETSRGSNLTRRSAARAPDFAQKARLTNTGCHGARSHPVQEFDERRVKTRPRRPCGLAWGIAQVANEASCSRHSATGRSEQRAVDLLVVASPRRISQPSATIRTRGMSWRRSARDRCPGEPLVGLAKVDSGIKMHPPHHNVPISRSMWPP